MPQPFDAAVDLFEKLRMPQLAEHIANINNGNELATNEVEVEVEVKATARVVSRDDDKRDDRLPASFAISASEFAIHFEHYVPQIKNSHSKKLLLSILRKCEIFQKKKSTLLHSIFENDYLSISKSFLPFLKPVLTLVKFSNVFLFLFLG